jgi:hypothetical protein
VQEIEYVVFEIGETLTELEVAPPVEKPVPVHEVAPVELQASVEEPPVVMLEGVAVSVAVGVGWLTVTVAVAGALEPLAPVHVTV